MSPKGRRVTLIAALQSSGVCHFEVVAHSPVRRGLRARDVGLFLVALASKVPAASCIVLDNAKLHHAEELEPTWKMLEDANQIRHKFLPPYSPFLNPIELLFSVLKSNLRKLSFSNVEELENAIAHFLTEQVPESLCAAWFRHASQFLPQCMARKPFDGTIIKDCNDP